MPLNGRAGRGGIVTNRLKKDVKKEETIGRKTFGVR